MYAKRKNRSVQISAQNTKTLGKDWFTNIGFCPGRGLSLATFWLLVQSPLTFDPKPGGQDNAVATSWSGESRAVLLVSGIQSELNVIQCEALHTVDGGDMCWLHN